MANKRSGNERNTQNGFILVAALIAVMILMAVGIYALTTSSQDIRSTVRSVSEGNALSAAEAGVHTLSSTFDPVNVGLADIPTTGVQGAVDIHGDTIASYNVTGQVLLDTIAISPGMGAVIGSEFFYNVYNTQVTGTDNILNGQVTLQVGIVDATPRSAN